MEESFISTYLNFAIVNNDNASHRHTNPNCHEDHVIPTKNRNNAPQDHTTHLLSGTGTFTHCRLFNGYVLFISIFTSYTQGVYTYSFFVGDDLVETPNDGTQYF